MRRLLLVLVFLCIATVTFGEALEYGKVYLPKPGMTADEIMRINYHNFFSSFAQDYYLPKSIIYYVDKDGFTRTKESFRERIVLAGKDGISYKDLIVITQPTSSKGLAILTWTYEDANKDQDTWLWIPSLKKVRKVSASEADDAFMGSDLTVEEVSTRRFEGETYKLMGEKTFDGYTFEHTGVMKDKGKDCFVIECIPTKPHWYYAKRIVWIDKETGGNIFDEYYDKNGNLFKTLYREWAWYMPETKKYPMQVSVECKDLRTGHRTAILNFDPVYDKGLEDRDFTVRMLERSIW